MAARRLDGRPTNATVTEVATTNATRAAQAARIMPLAIKPCGTVTATVAFGLVVFGTLMLAPLKQGGHRQPQGQFGWTCVHTYTSANDASPQIGRPTLRPGPCVSP